MIANCFFKDSNLTENKAFSSATKRKFRKVVAFPPASDIFLSFDKKNNTVHMLNTMALKEQQTLLGHCCSGFPEYSKQWISDNGAFERENLSRNKHTLSSLIKRLENQTRQQKKLEKYPSTEPEIIAFYINRQRHVNKLLQQNIEQKDYQGYETVITSSIQVQNIWLQILKTDTKSILRNKIQQENQTSNSKKREAQFCLAEVQKDTFSKRSSFSSEVNRLAEIIPELATQSQSNGDEVRQQRVEDQGDSGQSDLDSSDLIKLELSDLQTIQEECETSQAYSIENYEQALSQQPYFTQSLCTNYTQGKYNRQKLLFPPQLYRVLISFFENKLLQQLDALQLSKLCLSLSHSKEMSFTLSRQSANQMVKLQSQIEQSQAARTILSAEKSVTQQAQNILSKLRDVLKSFEIPFIVQRLRTLTRPTPLKSKGLSQILSTLNQNSTQYFGLNYSENSFDSKQCNLDQKKQLQNYYTKQSRFIEVLSLLESLNQKEYCNQHQENKESGTFLEQIKEEMLPQKISSNQEEFSFNEDTCFQSS